MYGLVCSSKNFPGEKPRVPAYMGGRYCSLDALEGEGREVREGVEGIGGDGRGGAEGQRCNESTVCRVRVLQVSSPSLV